MFDFETVACFGKHIAYDDDDNARGIIPVKVLLSPPPKDDLEQYVDILVLFLDTTFIRDNLPI